MVQRKARIQATEEDFSPSPEAIPLRARPDDLAIERQGGNGKAPGPPPSPKRDVQGVYIISVAARLLEMHPQTLRKYERMGLVSPDRTQGMLRLYSDRDLRKVRLIRYLETKRRMNLAGVQLILSLMDYLLEMQARLSEHRNAQILNSLVERELDLLLRRLNLPFKI